MIPDETGGLGEKSVSYKDSSQSTNRGTPGKASENSAVRVAGMGAEPTDIASNLIWLGMEERMMSVMTVGTPEVAVTFSRRHSSSAVKPQLSGWFRSVSKHAP